MATDCLDCPLRCRPLFVPMTTEEITFMRQFKAGERTIPPGADVVTQGQTSTALYTVLSGMAVRSIHLPEGQRQVISFTFPGDLIGLQ
jgi:CRP/FNR family transcriptional regulator, anaerobic regulatory protein